jgi:hypothetical protein
LIAIPADTHVRRRHADNRSRFVVKHLVDGKARINLDAKLRGLLAEPPYDQSETADVVAVVAHQRRHEKIRKPYIARRTEHEELIVLDLSRQRRTALTPIRDQTIKPDRIDHCARKDVRTDFAALLEDDDGNLSAFFSRELLDADRRCEPSRPRTHNHNIELHGLPLGKVSFTPRHYLLSHHRHCDFFVWSQFTEASSRYRAAG